MNGFGASFLSDAGPMDPIAEVATGGLLSDVEEPVDEIPEQFWRLKHRLSQPIDMADVPRYYQAVQAHLQRPPWQLTMTDEQIIEERNSILKLYADNGRAADGRRTVGSERHWLRLAARERARHAFFVNILAQLEQHLSGKGPTT